MLLVLKKTQQKVWVKILQMNKKLIKNSWKMMKLYNKKSNNSKKLLIFNYKKGHLKFSSEPQKLVELALQVKGRPWLALDTIRSVRVLEPLRLSCIKWCWSSSPGFTPSS